MKLLITGGAGFIGSHLAGHCLDLGHEVTIVDELNDYYDPALKRRNLDEIREHGDYTFHLADICDEAEIDRIFAETSPDAVIHLAARAGVRPSLEQPLLYSHANVTGTLVLLEACRRFAVKRFVFASSSSVYGATDAVPFREDAIVSRPVSPYAATKLAGEQMTYTFSRLYDIRTVCLRFFTVYGPRQRPDLAIRKFVERIDQGLPIQVFGDGSSGRDYTYVADIVAGITAAIGYETSWDIFNLGNSSPVTLSEMVAAVEAAVGRPARIERLPFQPGDVPITYADISKAARLLGYAPHTSFRDGLARFVDWYRGAAVAI